MSKQIIKNMVKTENFITYTDVRALVDVDTHEVQIHKEFMERKLLKRKGKNGKKRKMKKEIKEKIKFKQEFKVKAKKSCDLDSNKNYEQEKIVHRPRLNKNPNMNKRDFRKPARNTQIELKGDEFGILPHEELTEDNKTNFEDYIEHKFRTVSRQPLNVSLLQTLFKKIGRKAKLMKLDDLDDLKYKIARKCYSNEFFYEKFHDENQNTKYMHNTYASIFYDRDVEENKMFVDEMTVWEMTVWEMLLKKKKNLAVFV